MTTQVLPKERPFHFGARPELLLTRFAAALVPYARVLFALIFLRVITLHLSRSGIAYGAQMGVPYAPVLVPLAGIMAFAGGLSIAFGYHARVGAALLALFLIPVTIVMHPFWRMHEPMQYALQQAMFLKNVALIGASVLLMYFGSGPASLDRRLRRGENGAGPASTRATADE